jgi:hypothetical protein
MANNLAYTPGIGAQIRTSQGGASGAHMQVIKIATGVEGDENYLPATAANGLTVDVTRVQGAVVVNNPTAANLKVDASGVAVPITDNAASLTVDAPAGTPVAVRLSTGAAFIDTIPVSIAAAVAVTGTVSITGTPAVAQSGVWNIGAVTSITNTVTVAGTVAISGTVPVSGTLTANQGTAAAVGNAWVMKITDGANAAALTNVAGSYALKVDIVKQTGGGYSQQERTAFTDGTTPTEVIGGVFNDAITAAGAGQAAAARITPNRALHFNIRKQDGTELGIAATPLRTDPTGVTTQPVSGTVTANQGGAPWQVQPAPSTVGVWRIHFAYTASLADQAIHTPAGGKTVYLEGLIITPTAAGALLKIYDQTNADANMLYAGQPPLGTFVITPARPLALSAANNILRWATGAAATGDVVAWGYEV